MTPTENLPDQLRDLADEIEFAHKLFYPMSELVHWIVQPDHPIGSNAEFVSKVKAKAKAIKAVIDECERQINEKSRPTDE